MRNKQKGRLHKAKAEPGDLQRKKTLQHLAWCLGVALLVTLLNARGMMDARIIPFGDAGGFYHYALKLYGYVHTAQWSNVMSTLGEMSTNLFPSSFFFLFLPESQANTAGYGLVNNLCWHLLAVAGIWVFLRALGHEKFTIPVFLLVSANNFAFDPTYYYYMDLPFMGLTLLALAMAVTALKSRTTGGILLAGAFGALPFLGKPPNAFINTALLVLFMGGVLLTELVGSRGKSGWRFPVRFASFWTAGFVPVFILASLCGALQSIAHVAYANEVGKVFYTELSETGLKRALYFPLCLSFYYSIPLIIGLLIVLVTFRFLPQLRTFSTGSTERRIEAPTRTILGWIFLIFILFWGLYFSFKMQHKVIRSLPLMLPVGWILLLTATPLRSLRLSVVLPLTALFFLLPFAQAEKGFLSEKQNRNPEVYRITGDWFNRWPSKRPNLALGTATTDELKSLLNQSGVHGGKVAVGSEMISWNAHALDSWCNQESLRKGRPPAYEFRYICPGKFKKPLGSSMEGADALLLILEPRVQYSQNLYKINVDLANYALQNWKDKEAEVNVVLNEMQQPAVCVVAFKQPLQGDTLSKLEIDLYGGRFDEKGEAASEFDSLTLWGQIRFLLPGKHEVN